MKRPFPVLPALALALCLLSPARAAVLSVDGRAERGKPINDHIYGVNIANWCQHYYLKLCEPRLTNAGVTIVRYGATNIERYNWRNNRMYNVISKENQFVPMSWEAFVNWVRDDLQADPFLQASVFGHVAADYNASDYNTNQVSSDITEWVEAAGTNVGVWGVGNEPFIAWKLEGYEGNRSTNHDDEGYAYNDGAHGDQIYNEDIAADSYFPKFIEVAAAIRAANSNALILGPTPANWWLYWSTDYSPFCPATRDYPGEQTNDNGWFTMAASANQWDPHVFPDRAGDPGLIGWEKNELTGTFNDQRVMCQFAKRIGEHAAANGGVQVCDYLDFHRYMNCDQDAMAVQETRDLWDPDYASYDKETGGSGTKTRILDRFQNIIDHYYTNMHLSLSEYDYFYWQGHPAEQQISALGQIDYLGTFAKYGVQLACNWYVGEPDQSGGGYHHAADSAKQAMFNEMGEPNPKYWAFKLMSDNFRDTALMAESSENGAFSVYAGIEPASSQLVVVAQYKGVYYPWNDEHNPGGFIEGQGNSNATIVVSNFTVAGVRSVHRFGRYDPFIVHMETGGVSVASGQFAYEFEPLSVYVFRFHGRSAPPVEEEPDSYLIVDPSRVDFGPYEDGMEIVETEDEETHEITITTNCTHGIKVCNNRNGGTTWSVSENAGWLVLAGPTSGTATVSDRIFLEVTNRNLAVGVYSTDVQVVTSEGTVWVPVTMEVLPGEAGGELRLFDAETHSLAHAWGATEPYSLGFYDGHGNTEDRNDPYIYTFAMDYDEVSPLGGLASLRVDFDRAAGDDSAGRLYTAFGTYGHYDVTACWVPTNANPSNYVFKFDVKTKTEGTGFTRTRLLVVITDDSAVTNKGKPDVRIDDFKQSMEIEDGFWQTISIPLGTNFFDWRYPEGQDGSLAAMDFSRIRQVEFCPWVGREDKKGSLWLDNLRIETVDAESNLYPVAIVVQDKQLIGTNETVALSATNSYDVDGAIAQYAWSPSTGLSATNTANVTFTPPGPGVYTFNLTVTDDEGLRSRDPAQAVVKVIPTLVGTSLKLYRQTNFTDEVSGTASNCLDLYVKLICSAGGSPDDRDFTLARVTTDDTYSGDAHNDVAAIDVVLEETGVDSKVFTGHVRLAAFSDEVEERIGVSDGVSLIVSNAGVSANVVMGRQTYGYEKFVDHIERGDGAFNNFEGPWYEYADNYNANTSVVFMATSNGGARSTSTQSMHGWGVLRLGPTGSVDQLFAGIATKLSRLTEETTNAVCDLSSTTGVRGISFWLKGNGRKLAVVLRSMAVTNYDDYLCTIDFTPSGWRKVHLLFTDFQQEGWGNEALERDHVLRFVNSLQFKFASKINGETNHVYIDDLALIGGDVTYSTNAVYNKGNSVSMEGFAGLLTNSTFEGPAAPGWMTNSLVRNEDWGGWMMVAEHWNGTSASDGWFYQNVTSGVSVGSSYKFDIQAQPGGTAYTGNAYIDLIWLDSGGLPISTNTTDITSALDPALFKTFSSGWQVAPDGAAGARVQARSEDSTVPPYTDNCLKFDNAAFSGPQLPDSTWYLWSGLTVSYTTNCSDGVRAAQLDSTNTDWVAGMFVPAYDTGEIVTNFAGCDGIAIKARRPDGYASTGGTHARIRMSVVTGETEIAKTRWYPVDGSEWEDYILFSKDNFYTLGTADTTDPAALVEWTNDWTAIDRVYIYYGPATNELTPYDLILDDFRACSGTYVH